MKARRSITVTAVLLLGLAAWPAVGCGVDVGLTQEVAIDEALGSAGLTAVELSMGAGSLSISPGATGLAAGTIEYNVESWAPVVVRTDAGLSIKQGSQKGISGLGTDVVNDWNLQLGKAPITLNISAGAYKGSYDLSGLTIQELIIKDGAARSQVMFNSPNPGQMSRFEYSTGASSVTLIGLANANFKAMKFTAGAGAYSLDFSGQLRTDAGVKVETGAGSVRIIVPASTAAKVAIDGALNDVSTEGVWTKTDKIYTTTAVGTQGQGKMLTITVEMNVGAVTLVAK